MLLGWGEFFIPMFCEDKQDMAIGAGSLVEFTVRGQVFSQNWMNVYTYQVVGELGSPSASNWGEAFWNKLKATYRPLISSAHGAAFLSVLVREMDSALGEYGEFAIPAGERAGTGASGAGNVAQPFIAAGIRLTVATRLTRPGQKRIPGQDETDMNGANWETTYQTKLNSFGVVISSAQTLDAPALGSQIKPVVVRRDPTTGLPTAHQDVTGFLVANQITSQVSRKIGRGS